MRNIPRRNALSGFAALAGLPFIQSCAVNPVTGKFELMLLSIEKEIKMGVQADREISQNYGIYDDESIGVFFDQKGQEMSRVTHRKNLKYTFRVLDSPVVNAFAVPGGFVYVTRGILAFFNDEAQFAGVLGHELGHVNARHTAKRYSKAIIANFGLQIGTLFSEEFSRYADLAQLGTSLLFLKFSRNDEREADRLGVEYSSKVGYDATHMSDFFKSLQMMTTGHGSLPSWMSTHPDPGDRINATRSMAQKFQQNNPDILFKVNRDEYLDLINGIVYGDDSRQGYTADGYFFHPVLLLKFPVPAGWILTNTPTQVNITSKDKKGIIIFTLAQGTTFQSAVNSFLESTKAEPVERSKETVNGLKAEIMRSYIQNKQGTTALISYFIMKDNTIFVFHGLSGETLFETYRDSFERTMRGFSQLTDNSRIDVQPGRIEVRKTTSPKKLKNILNEWSVPEDQLQKLAVLNGMTLDTQIPGGSRLKTVV